MKNKPLDTTISPDDSDEKEHKGAPGELNSPALDEVTGKPANKAISSYKQAHAIAKRQYDRAKESRLITAATIARKYGGEAPHSNKVLADLGQDWRNNFSTNPLGAVVDRSTPQLSNPIKQAEYLTYSALPPERENASEKTRKFRLRTTKLVRSWSGWVSLIGQTGQENYLFGNAAPGWIDDDWRPKAFRHDETFLPDGTGQHASQVQFIVYRQPMLLHDFLQKIEDKEIAEDAGYNWEGCIKAANEAAGLRSDGDKSPLQESDAIREGGSLGFTHDGETKIVWLFHVLVREYAGGVNLWTVAEKGGHGIRKVENIHEGMEDATTLFTLQEGNTKFYGSRGAGRQLANLHIALDRHRNFGADKSYLAGLPIWKVKGKDLNGVNLSVRSPFIFMLGDAEMMTEVIQFDVMGHEYLEKNLTQLMEQVAGAFLPPKLDDAGGATTKIEAAQEAERQLAVKDGVLGRWFGQFANLMSAIQRKVFKPDNIKEAIRLFEQNKKKKAGGIKIIAKKVFRWLEDVLGKTNKNSEPQEESATADADAVQLIVDLLEDGLTPEDIVELALSPAGNGSEEKPEEQDQKTKDFIIGMQGTALATQFDLKKSAQMISEISIGEDRAKRLILPDQEDPNVEAVATRQQIQEWLAMVAHEPQPVASTDLHRIHRKVMMPRTVPIMQALTVQPQPEMLEFAKLALDHYAGHVAMDSTLTEEMRAAEEQQLAAWQQAIAQADKAVAKMAQEAAKAGVEGGASNVPSPIDGQPPQMDIDLAKLESENALRRGDQEIKHRELDIKEAQLQQKDHHEAFTATNDALKTVAEKTEAARQQGIKDEEAERARESAQVNPEKPKM